MPKLSLSTLAFLFALVCSPHAFSQSFALKGTALRISDGDTITMRLDHNGSNVEVRLAEIDAPEIAHGEDRPTQPYGDIARDNLRKLVSIGEEVDAQCYEKDERGRSVCRVNTSRGTDLSLAMVSAGHAQAYRRYVRDSTILIAEGKAKASSLGLWSGAYPIAPETWRRICWDASLRPDNAWCEDGKKPWLTPVVDPSHSSAPDDSRTAKLKNTAQTAYNAIASWLGDRYSSFLGRFRT
jgi:endonuclease YncB( thermonuclease family)